MANLSSAHGTIEFQHPTAPVALIEKLVDYTIEHFQYGALMFNESLESEIELDWKWNNTYDFDSLGRWTFYNTLSHYFEEFNDAEFKDELDGMSIKLNYIDYEPGTDIFVKESIEIKASLDDNGQLQTIICNYNTSDIEYTAENLIQHHIADAAFDTTTEYGVAKFKHYVEKYMNLHPDAFVDEPELRKLVLNIRNVPVDELLEAFIDHDVTDTVDYEEFDDGYYITNLLLEKLIIEHDAITPYIK